MRVQAAVFLNGTFLSGNAYKGEKVMKFARRFLNSRLSIKIIMYYLTIFILLAILCIVTFENLNNGMAAQKVNQLSAETVNSLNANLDFLINTVNNQSKMLISSETLQEALRDGNQSFNSGGQKTLDDYLSEFTNFYDAISSIYIFDNSGHEYFVDNLYYQNISLEKIKAASWYGELRGKDGGYILKLNAGGIYAIKADDMNYVSLIRVINDINTQKPLGIMIINISEDYIDSSFGSVTSTTNTKIMLNDENNRQVLHSGAIGADDLAAISKNAGGSGSSQIKTVNGTQYIISCLKDRYNWTIAAVTPISELASQSQSYNIFVVFIVFINIALLVLALIFTSLFITKPINRLAKAMASVKNGAFNEVSMHTGADEIGMLKDVYNLMIREIRKLFDNVVSEQKDKRKAELEALQSQIKPHFLYNSFDAISSLALSGNNRDVYTLVKALGKFYRSFLNTGSEEIAVGEELEIVRQYLTIQQIRFKDKFTVAWQIDERVNPFKIPRLTLQPLVENAIKHGIRAKPGSGVLKILALYGEDKIELVVEDDGVGMDARERETLLNGESHGAGLKITRERLELYFNSPSVFELRSEKGRGTVAKITIPVVREADDDGRDD
jgi:Predicted signal transduction protein with a C-terminal ATPase domain